MTTENETTMPTAILRDGEIYSIGARFYRVDFCLAMGEWAEVRIPECNSSNRRHTVFVTELKRVKGQLVERVIKQRVGIRTERWERRPVRQRHDYLPGAVARGEATLITDASR